MTSYTSFRNTFQTFTVWFAAEISFRLGEITSWALSGWQYEFFDELIKKYETDILFTAHHGDDLVETILMRLTRGSSIKGYSGFDSIATDRGYKIVRPLIYLTKEEILNNLDKKNIWYANDMSNIDEKYPFSPIKSCNSSSFSLKTSPTTKAS